MKEFFVVANSFAAPFFSDTSHRHVQGEDARDALTRYVKSYDHPAGLYAALVYDSADAYHKGDKAIVQWLCNHEQAKQRATAGKSSYGYLGHGPGDFEIDGERITIEDPRGGSVVVSAVTA